MSCILVDLFFFLFLQLKTNETITTIPTIGFNVEEVQYRNVTFTMWDVGGQDKIRRLWGHYFRNTQGLLFVCDSADSERIGEAREELRKLLQSDELRGVPVVVAANKQDMPGALSASQLAEKLGLHQLRDHAWFVQPSCARTGEGVVECLDQLADLIKESRKRTAAA